MIETTTFIVNILFRLFDAFNVIGLLWFFIFLKDLVPKMKKYIISSLVYAAITLHSKLMTSNVAIRRSQTMSIAAVSAILAYIFVILADASKIFELNLVGEIFAILAGVVFYIGFIMPAWLRKIWEK